MDKKKKSRKESKIVFQFIPTEFTLNRIGLSSSLSTENDVYRLLSKSIRNDIDDMSPSELLLEDYLTSLYLHLKSLREAEFSQLQTKINL